MVLDTFTRTTTAELKGLAISLMLFLHLFHGSDTITKYTSFCYIGHDTLTHILSSLCNPVYAFTFLSGYGLFIAYSSQGRLNVWQRLNALYLKYWLSLIIFVFMGYCLGLGDKYPGSWLIILENVTSWKTSYNGTIWFLFPYSVLLIASPKIFYFLNSIHRIWSYVAVFLLFVVCSMLLHWYGSFLISNHPLYVIEHIAELLIPFIIGMIFVRDIKYSVIKKKLYGQGTTVVVLLLFVFCFIGILIRDWPLGLFTPIYVLGLYIYISLINIPKYLSRVLCSLGKHSTSIWFIHAYYCWYFFPNEVYSLKYPIFIFLGLLGSSYISALLLDFMFKGLFSKVFKSN